MADVDVDKLLEAPYEEGAGAKRPRDEGGDGDGVDAKRRRRSSSERDERRERRDSRERRRDSRDRHRDDRDRDRYDDRERRRSRDRHIRDRRNSRDDRDREGRSSRDYYRDRDRRDGSRGRDRGGDRYDEREYGRRGGGRDRYEEARGGRYDDRRGGDRYRERDYARDRGPRGGAPGSGANSTQTRLTPAQILERGERTILAMGMPTRASRAELMEFFEQAGAVADIRLVEDRHGRSRGIGYIEYEKKDCVPQALQLNGMPCKGYPVRVMQSQAEKNDTSASLPVGPTKVSVRNVHPSLMEGDIRDLFGEFGRIDSITMQPSEAADENGSAVVAFKNPDDAKLAVSRIDGLDLGGIILEVALMNRPSNAPTGPAATGGMFGRTSDLDDESDIMPMSAAKRAMLMQNLGRGLTSQSSTTPAAPPAAPAPVAAARPSVVPPKKSVSGTASRCILLKNMFNPEEETDPGWDKEIEEETKEEAAKFGAVTHCHVDANSKGFVYLKFGTVTAASEAANKFNGRYFGGNCVEAAFMPEEIYSIQFPSTAS